MHKLPCFTIKANSMLGVDEGYKRAFDALQRITKMPYRRRIWVVQEIILPPLATVVWGSISSPWKIFVYAAMNFEKHISGCCLAHNSPGFCFNKLRAFKLRHPEYREYPHGSTGCKQSSYLQTSQFIL
jgi:hypothetical protein